MSGTVVVYCKHLNGLHLTVKGSAGVDHTIRVNGPANKVDQPPHCVIVAGAAATVIDKDHWDAWIAAHAGYGPVKAGLIWANSKPEEAKAQANDSKAIKSGFEPLDPFKPGNGVKPDADWLKSQKKNIHVPEE